MGQRKTNMTKTNSPTL